MEQDDTFLELEDSRRGKKKALAMGTHGGGKGTEASSQSEQGSNHGCSSRDHDNEPEDLY